MKEKPLRLCASVAKPNTDFEQAIEFVKTEKQEAEKALKFREESELMWRTGTEAEWRAAGCTMTKSRRLKTSEIHGRIAIKCRRRIELFKAVLNELSIAQSRQNPCASVPSVVKNAESPLKS